MKNMIKITTTVATIFAGTAAFAQGNQVGFVQSGEPRAEFLADIKHENANATTGTMKTTERGVNREVPVTLFVNDSADAAGSAAKGR